jgi:type IV pilus assembly protein PilZ
VSDNDNTRRADRLQHEVLVAYRTVAGFMTDWAVNISKGGLFVNTRSPLEVGSEVKLILSLPDGNPTFDLLGRVSWVNPQSAAGEPGAAPGMGIEFLDVDTEKKARLEAFVKKLNESFFGQTKP